jgi:hypothetical protein
VSVHDEDSADTGSPTVRQALMDNVADTFLTSLLLHAPAAKAKEPSKKSEPAKKDP